ncbi:PRC-barrel domain protein [Sulfitobacter sp. THAF37]|uniref:PRC-barrel domain-containing protein n=1 Tax=Sulfitobacter sp. THAF37 TaxID=2587855 RepID=UPI0012AA665F|nr:PRC-barrel domain-containing protein [Sulfitobacter sp. THAF37]QFT60343.1 PRC-barrel domain protein [Sulfitobacter sp. THAF37]
MTNLKQHASTLALIATLTATPAILAAQTATEPADGTATEQPMTQDNAEAPTDETTSEDASDTADAEMPADDAASDTAEAPADDTMSSETSDTAEAPADDAMSSDTAEAPGADPMATDDTDTAAVPAEDGMSADGTQTAEAATEEPAKEVEGQIRMQGENTILADDLIGTNVYSTAGENIGEIDDLIVNLDGSVEGAVIGVGGFLGIGEKWVAVSMDSLSTQQDENGNVTLTSSATKVDLEAAEPFVTARDLAAAQRSVETAPVDGGVQTQPVE